MHSDDLSFADASVAFPRADIACSTPQLGDVLDSIEDARATLGRSVRNKAEGVLADARGKIRAQPLGAVAVVGVVAYVLGRLLR